MTASPINGVLASVLRRGFAVTARRFPACHAAKAKGRYKKCPRVRGFRRCLVVRTAPSP